MNNNDKNKNNYCRILVALLIVVAAFQCVSAADLPANPIAGAMHVNINTANSGGYYIKFDGGGLNALHITTSTTDRYGQLTTTSMKSGTFYLSDTGGRGFFNNVLLMVAIRKPAEDEDPIPDDFRLKIRSSGYNWIPTGVLNQPPVAEDLEYVSGAVDQTFTISSLSYGPQKWKPAGNNDPMNYPIYGDQDITSDEEFYLYFIDLKVGNLGENSFLPGLIDNGMVKVEYTIENFDSGLVAFNTYGWCAENQANQGEGVSWTNRIVGEGASGYVVDIVGSGGGEGGSSGKISYDSDDSSVFPGSWRPQVGNLNISSTPAGAKIYFDGVYSGEETNASFVDVPAGDHSVYLEYDGYEPTEPKTIRVKSGYITEEKFILEKGSGSCFVSSVPAGADIFVDGNDTLWHTDSVITDIESGNHTITVYHDGYSPQSADVTIRMDEQSDISFVFGGEGESVSTPGTATPDVRETPDDTPVSGNDAAVGDAGTGMDTAPSAPGETVINDDGGIIGYIFSFFGAIFSGAPEESESVPDTASGTSVSSSQGISPVNTPSKSDKPVYDAVTDVQPENSAVTDVEKGTGGLYVTSYPDTLPITLDGVKTDRSTPEYFYGLKEGSHTVMVRYSSDTVQTAMKTVYITGGDDSYVKLEPGVFSQKVPVSIQSKDFKDCIFMIEGEYPEYSFPSKVYVEKSGTYVTVEKDGVFYSFNTGHQEENSVLKIVSPKSIDTIGKITITSTPEGADVCIDGCKTGLRTPCTVEKIAEGQHVIEVSKGGYYPERKVIQFVNTGESDNSEFSFIMKEYPYGSLQVESTPSGAMVYLRGQYTGVTTPHEFEYMPIGSYDVAVVHNRTTFTEGSATVLPLDKSGVTVYNLTLDM
ncbi:PEGA domain-containing protein [Methanogenium organophilum]|uniref:PEGA domain-containing protein n=1 Tax=Methanogenium organophilum TaxID=2199 RepID=A0A9X9T7W4_METOG|nr:PEGA domain-containing protein [Methanogenium organophilum]WAI00522.1 PEGA domain-containing protein [Methanogenium organophilum]